MKEYGDDFKGFLVTDKCSDGQKKKKKKNKAQIPWLDEPFSLMLTYEEAHMVSTSPRVFLFYPASGNVFLSYAV